MGSITFAIEQLEYDQLDKEIKRVMKRSAKDVVQIGFMLRQMYDKRLWAQSYDCFDEYLDMELNIDYTMANRFMNINKKYSLGGNSMEIAAKYEQYSQGVLVEMLNMPPKLEAKVTPDMTVREVREIKRQVKPKKEKEPEIQEKENEIIIDGEYREVKELEPVAMSQDDNDADVHDEFWFVQQYVQTFKDEAQKLFKICRENSNNAERAKAVQQFLAPYGCHATHCSEYDFSFHGFTGGMDFRVGEEKMHLKYGRFVAELMKFPEAQVATSQGVSAYGFPKTEYPEGSLLTTQGCGHKYQCFTCAQDCGIRQEERYCTSAPLGTPFSCITMNVLPNLKIEMAEKCPFVNQELARHTSASNEAVPCCTECQVPDCGYRCQHAVKAKKSESVKENIEQDSENGAGVTYGGLTDVRLILEREKKTLNDYLEVGGLPEWTVFRQKTIVGALAAMVCELENAEPEQGEPEQEESETTKQPILPELKNNDQRKKWLENYKAWGLWYRDEKVDVNYYKYDFEEGSRLVVADYPARRSYWSDESRDEHYYHLLEKNKKGYKKSYDEKYRHTPDSETSLVEFLKNLQKNKK